MLIEMQLNLYKIAVGLTVLCLGQAVETRSGSIPTVRQLDWRVGQTVNTTSGIVQGHGATYLSTVSEYLGIPYAQPPVGKLRFQPPLKYSSSSFINASAFSPSCHSTKLTPADHFDPAMYANYTLTTLGSALLMSMLQATGPESEDCLTLNVWTKPQVGERKKAVLVFIHGGAFVSGSSSLPGYDGEFLSEKEDVILVSLNYRLSIFGFPGNPTTPPNLGLLDQRMALEWVRDNIASFGGDPSRITLFGQSAGSASVDLHAYAFASDPIAHAFILQSGTATSFGQLPNATANALWFNASAALGCGGSSADRAAVLACMLAANASAIAAAVPGSTSSEGAALDFSPTIDDTLVFGNYSGRAPAARPVLVGNNDNEAGLLRLLSPEDPDGAWPAVNLQTFTCPAGARAAANVQQGNPTWRYRYFGEFPNLRLTTKPPSGAWHSSELPILFNTTSPAIAPDTAAEQAIADYMRGAWATFTKDPANGLIGYGWPRYATDGQTLVRLAYDNQTGPNLARGNEYDTGCPPVAVVGSPGPSGTSSPTPVPTSGASSDRMEGIIGPRYVTTMYAICGILFAVYLSS